MADQDYLLEFVLTFLAFGALIVLLNFRKKNERFAAFVTRWKKPATYISIAGLVVTLVGYSLLFGTWISRGVLLTYLVYLAMVLVSAAAVFLIRTALYSAKTKKLWAEIKHRYAHKPHASGDETQSR